MNNKDTEMLLIVALISLMIFAYRISKNRWPWERIASPISRQRLARPTNSYLGQHSGTFAPATSLVGETVSILRP